jgi:hypothetical protein
MDKLDRYMLRVGTRPAGAEHDEPAAAMEPDRHGVARRRDRPGLSAQVTGGIPAQLEQPGDLRPTPLKTVAVDLPRPCHRPRLPRAIGVTIEPIAAR